MIVEELKKSILNYAIQGYLTKKEINDGSIEDILNDIEREKKLLSKKEILIGSTIMPIENNIFEIPKHWKFVRLGNIAKIISKGTTPKGGKSAYKNAGIRFVRAENVNKNIIFNEDTKYIDEVTHNNELKRSILKENDILICIAGTLGRCGVVLKKDLPLNTNQAVAFVRLVNSNLVNPWYLYYVISSELIQKQLIDQKKITAIPNLTLEIITNCIIPIPSFEEQQRIVDKIEELFKKLDEIKPIEEELTSIKNKFPYEMKKSILTSAFEGKLTMRMKSDSSIDCLIEQIRQIRDKKIKNKEAKADKYSDVVKYNLYFDIPDEWKWLKVGEIGNWGSGSTPERGNAIYYENGTVSWLKTGELTDGYVGDSEEKITELALSKCSLKINNPGDILIAMYGATIGKLAIATTKTTTNQACCGCSLYGDMNNKYLFYYLLSIRHKLISLGEGSGQPNISREKIINLQIPIPSIEEQDRIVKKIEQLLPLCDDIDNLVNN